MTKYLLGIVTGLALAVGFALFLAAAAWLIGRQGQPVVSSDSVLTMRLSGNIPEHLETDFPFGGFADDDGGPLTLFAAAEAIREAANDDDIKALALECRGFGAGWAKAQEIRWAVERFKESGKPVWAYLGVAGELDYYVASAADRVVIQPESVLDVKGLRAEVAFYKEMFDKIGVAAEMENVGKYKSAVEPYSRNTMSDAFREALNVLLDDVYAQLLRAFVEGRGRGEAHWRGVIDNGPFLSTQALDYGLVDAVLYEDRFFRELNEAAGADDLERVSLRQYARGFQSAASGKKIAMIYAVGTILSGRSRTEPFTGQRVLGSRSFVEMLDGVSEDDDIAAAVLRIDSPGGDAIASDQMLRAVRRLRENKPLVISMSNLAASGGYYIAAAEDTKIVAYPGTYTGSIGVYFGKISLGELYEKIGINVEVLTRGRYAGIDSDSRTLTRDERAMLRKRIESVYETFVTRVAEARGRGYDAIHEVAQGRVWLGTQALENGLVDELGGFERALELAREAAGIGAEEEVRLIGYPPPKNFIEVLFESGNWLRADPLAELARAKLAAAAGWPALARGGILRLMPYNLTIR